MIIFLPYNNIFIEIFNFNNIEGFWHDNDNMPFYG